MSQRYIMQIVRKENTEIMIYTKELWIIQGGINKRPYDHRQVTSIDHSRVLTQFIGAENTALRTCA